MGPDRRPWRKLVKKLRRKKLRTEVARKRDELIVDNLQADNCGDSDDEDDQQLQQELEEQWLDREERARQLFEQKLAEEKRQKELEEEEKARIRKEWDELVAKQEAYKKEMEILEAEKKEKQVHGNLGKYFAEYEKEFNEFLDFLAGDIETPPLPYIIPDDLSGDRPVCPFFARTAACRFGTHCTRLHSIPTLSQTILIPNFFSHFSLEQTLRDEYDTDLNLEYEDSELYREFLVFYHDVLPEFQKFGDVIQFKVCCNYEAHLRGNVYVQYKDIRQAVEAYRSFNGRFYNGKQLSLQFVKIDSWRSAICGLFHRKRCTKKTTCSNLHAFRNPTKEFVAADNDWKPKQIPATATSHSSNLPGSSRNRNVSRWESTTRTERSNVKQNDSSSRGSNNGDIRSHEVSDRKSKKSRDVDADSSHRHKHKKKEKKHGKVKHDKKSPSSKSKKHRKEKHDIRSPRSKSKKKRDKEKRY